MSASSVHANADAYGYDGAPAGSAQASRDATAWAFVCPACVGALCARRSLRLTRRKGRVFPETRKSVQTSGVHALTYQTFASAIPGAPLSSESDPIGDV